MAFVIFNGKKIIPAPLVNINKTFQKTNDGTLVGSIFNIQIQGDLIAWKGSPTSSGSFWVDTGDPPDEDSNGDRVAMLLGKQQALRSLFDKANEGRLLEIQPCDGSIPTMCNPRINEINFEAGIWFDRVPYSISLEADVMYGSLIPASGEIVGEDQFSEYISEAEENWSLEFNDQAESPNSLHTFRLTHNVSAVGKRFYDDAGILTRPAWKQARLWVKPRLGIDPDRIIGSGTLNVPSHFMGWNHIRSENVDEVGGTYAVTETWLLSSGNALEDFNIRTDDSNLEPFTRVIIDGQIQGLENLNFNDSSGDLTVLLSAYEAASGLFEKVQNKLLSRAQTYSGVTLNPDPLSTSIGRNPLTGIITYTFEYDDRPTNCISGALTEDILIDDNNKTDIFAAHTILGRALGRILQSIDTVTEARRTISIQALMPKVDTCDIAVGIASKPDTSGIIVQAKPIANKVFKDTDRETWSFKTGQYSRQVGWTYND